MFERLLSESCRVQAQQALKYEGPAAMQDGFQTLGQVAARELFADPEVARGLAALMQYVDARKIAQARGPVAP